MTVAELIEFLKKQPQDIPVAFSFRSEQVLLEESDVSVAELCKPREDGWIQNQRPDMPTTPYLLFPGN